MGNRVTPHVVLINGPKRSGKDTGAAFLCNAMGAMRIGFADELKRRTHALYGLDPEPFGRFEDTKDTALPEFHGLTPRQAYIEVSERHYKRLHGEDVFGRLWLEAAERRPASLYVVPDSGFAPEAEVLAARYGRHRMTLVRLSRPGHDFAGDSRGYIALSGIRTFDLDNGTTGNPGLYLRDLLRLVQASVGGS